MRVSRRAWWIAAAVAVVPTLCVVGVALIGRELEDLRGGEGTLRDRSELVELQRRFRAMSPAQHLAEARAALVRFEASDAEVVHLRMADRHLDAIPAGAPEASPGAALRARAESHRAAALGRGVAALGEVATRAPAGPAGHSTRCAMFTALQQRGSLDVITPGQPHDETLVINLADCDVSTLRRLAGARDALLRMNVRTVRCADGGAQLRVEELR